MALSLNQVQKQTQKLIMTPQMQQSIQLLQMSAQELEQLATQEMVENPFLEIAEDVEVSEEEKVQTPEGELPEQQGNDELPNVIDFTYSSPEDAAPSSAVIDASTTATADDHHMGDMDVNWEEYYDDAESRVYTPTEPQEEERDFADYVALRENLYDNLKWQLHVSALNKKQVEIGDYIIGSLDDDGYLRVPLEELAEELKCSVQEIEDVLRVIQTFDPVGVGSRNLAECLRLQLENRGVRDKVVFAIVEQHLDRLQKKKFKEIARDLKIDEAQVREVFHQISHLEPKPGRARNSEDVKYIQPDVFVKKVDDKYMIYLNEGKTGGLRINRYYRQLLQQGASFEAKDKEFAMEKYKAAVWLIKNIEKRKSTILKVSEAVMTFQKEFLEKGTNALRPLTLKEIAEVVGMHESTVARVTTNKYIETPRGIFELKYFFSPGLETESGEDASSTSIKEMLAELIANENPKKPYSDQRLAELIRQKGINIARRTVAKYREQLRILSAKMRKEVA
jgi:RNA polymerase sigma-54 factor